MARWARAGARLCYVLCTSGDVGIAEPGMTRARATEIREAEQLAAAEIVGVKDVVFLREPDGMLVPRSSCARNWSRDPSFRPEVVVSGDPTIVWAGNDYINHPDHRAAATAALDATFQRRASQTCSKSWNKKACKPINRVKYTSLAGRRTICT